MAFLEGLSPLLLALLGWLLGLITPGITTYIRDRYRSNQLIKAIVQEMVEFQYEVAITSFFLHLRVGERLSDEFLSNEFLDRLISVLDNYRGPNRNEFAHQQVRLLRNAPLEARKAERANNSGGINVPAFYIPLFISHTSELAICPAKFRFLALKVRHHVDFFNDSAARALHWQEKTFDELSEHKSRAVFENFETTYYALWRQAEIIVRAIADLRSQYPANPET
jgi:hypothetical protein